MIARDGSIFFLSFSPGKRENSLRKEITDVLNQKVEGALNDQIKAEFESAYLYLSMSTHSEAANLSGIAHWLRLQWEEEITHAMKLIDYIQAQGNRVALKEIGQPKTEFGSPLSVFKEVLNHERKITKKLHQLNGLAVKEEDYATQTELQWFIREQVEEEKTVSGIMELLKMAGEQGPALLTIDRQLLSRGAPA